MPAANYSVQKLSVNSIEVIQLSDSSRQLEVLIAPSVGNIAYDMRAAGNPVLWSPYGSLGELGAKPTLAGVPFLGPWANRLDQEAFFANNRKYVLNPGLGNYRYDENHLPIHGLLAFAADWEVISTKADGSGAEVTSRLEYWKHPEWMAQFPFAHTIEMTYRLADGVLEVRTSIANLSREPMPLSVGFHPYFRITDAPRDEWRIHLAARSRYTLSPKLTPTGGLTPIDLPDPVRLAGRQFDDVYGDVVAGDEFWAQGKSQRISVKFGPKYRVAVVYAPSTRDVVCFEPMSGPTNAFNLAHEGLYKDLQSIPPGGTWTESFWIRPAGFGGVH